MMYGSSQDYIQCASQIKFLDNQICSYFTWLWGSNSFFINFHTDYAYFNITKKWGS